MNLPASAPILVVINGIPGTGKSTLARALAAELSMPYLCSDDIKELLLDKIGTGDMSWSRDLGDITTDMLFVLVDGLLAKGRSIIIESAFPKNFAQSRFQHLLSQRAVRFIEVYCRTEPGVRRQRFIARSESGARHPGHFDHLYYNMPDKEWLVRHAPLAIGQLIEIDTTEALSSRQLSEIIRRVRSI